MNKNKQKRTMKQKVSQKVIVNIKNAMPKSKPRRKAGTARISKSKSLSSQYTNPYLIGALKMQAPPDTGLQKEIQELKKTIEKKKEKKPIPLALPAPEPRLALPAPEPQRPQEDILARLMDAMRQHRDNNQAQGDMVANIQAQVRAEERAIVHNNPQPQVEEPEDNVRVPFPFQYEEVLAPPVVPSQRKKRGGARAGAGRKRKVIAENVIAPPSVAPSIIASPPIASRTRSMDEVLAESRAILKAEMKK